MSIVEWQEIIDAGADVKLDNIETGSAWDTHSKVMGTPTVVACRACRGPLLMLLHGDYLVHLVTS